METPDLESRASGLRWRDVLGVLTVISLLAFTVARLAVESPRSFFKVPAIAEAESNALAEVERIVP